MKTFLNKTKLTIAATPIGNLEEVSSRLINCLNEVDIILCEDTRVSSKLLNLLNINNKPKLISFHKHNEEEKNEYAIELIKEHSVLLISDAGYPTISDPGYKLIKECHNLDIAVEVINGPSALTHSIAVSGFDTQSFSFLGFLPRKNKEKDVLFNKYSKLNTVLVFYEAVHRIVETLEYLKNNFENNEIVICRELTKKNEEIIKSKLKDINLDEIVLKGEFVLVLKHDYVEEDISLEDIEDEILKEMNIKKSKDLSKELSLKYNISSKDIYKKILSLKEKK